ncbi:C-di-GMP phosphodiesterase [Paramixta manurensis]|uniref:C-di-GMP phosphodiesterase n=1 Tax=Paramixta manurensis TaxID=2740817 RepID=A0A6M8U342_9GAMM|nr:C-di-GMP phosphodiesterase [Erwiniaceae bacterium PD-1]
MRMKNIGRRLSSSDAVRQHPTTRCYWQQCRRDYTFQPIYRVCGRLMAIELLTAVFHPSAPMRRLSPEAYFTALDISWRLQIINEQLTLLSGLAPFFRQRDVMASVNIDGPTLLAIRRHPAIGALVASLPWVRFELVEHAVLPQEEWVAQMPELGALWLDDFGTGMANFSALTELKYEHVKLSRGLFTQLRQTDEGRHLFPMLLALINRYCKGVIVEGVETEEEWQQVRNSPACAAQGYYFARPAPFSQLSDLPFQLA